MRKFTKTCVIALAFAFAVSAATPAKSADAAVILGVTGLGLEVFGTPGCDAQTSCDDPVMPIILIAAAFTAVGIYDHSSLLITLPVTKNANEIGFDQQFPYLCTSDSRALSDLTKIKVTQGKFEKLVSSNKTEILVRVNSAEIDETLACNYSVEQINQIRTAFE